MFRRPPNRRSARHAIPDNSPPRLPFESESDSASDLKSPRPSKNMPAPRSKKAWSEEDSFKLIKRECVTPVIISWYEQVYDRIGFRLDNDTWGLKQCLLEEAIKNCWHYRWVDPPAEIPHEQSHRLRFIDLTVLAAFRLVRYNLEEAPFETKSLDESIEIGASVFRYVYKELEFKGNGTSQGREIIRDWKRENFPEDQTEETKSLLTPLEEEIVLLRAQFKTEGSELGTNEVTAEREEDSDDEPLPASKRRKWNNRHSSAPTGSMESHQTSSTVPNPFQTDLSSISEPPAPTDEAFKVPAPKEETVTTKSAAATTFSQEVAMIVRTETANKSAKLQIAYQRIKNHETQGKEKDNIINDLLDKLEKKDIETHALSEENKTISEENKTLSAALEEKKKEAAANAEGAEKYEQMKKFFPS